MNDYKAQCIDIVNDTQHKLIDIIRSMGELKNISINIKRDFGDFTEYMVINTISNDMVYYEPSELYVNGFSENIEELSVNELYNIIVMICS